LHLLFVLLQSLSFSEYQYHQDTFHHSLLILLKGVCQVNSYSHLPFFCYNNILILYKCKKKMSIDCSYKYQIKIIKIFISIFFMIELKKLYKKQLREFNIEGKKK